jgi:hypothetical protein
MRLAGQAPPYRFAPHGSKDASASPSQIQTWLDREPRANWAVATGSRSGILVLDIDGPEGERSLLELERRHGPMPELYPMQWTGRSRAGFASLAASSRSSSAFQRPSFGSGWTSRA